jgi:hypothetical protein
MLFMMKPNSIQVSRSNTETTTLQSIRGGLATQWSMYCLKSFCTKHRISGYKDKTGAGLCNLIVTKAKLNNLDSQMNPEEYVDDTEDEMEE